MKVENCLPQVVRMRDLKDRGIVTGWPQLRDLQIRSGFPSGRLIGPNTRVWLVDEVNAWLDSRPTGPSELAQERGLKTQAVLQARREAVLDQHDEARQAVTGAA
jgi:hypothetical protein